MEEEVRAPVEDRLDLAGLYSRIKNHIPIILGSTVGMMALAAGVTQFIPKKYSASAQLTYAPAQSLVKSETNTTPLSDEARDAEIEAQVQTIQSLDVARRVVAKQKLDKNPDIVEAAGRFMKGEGDRTDALAAATLQNLKVRRSGQSPLINVSYVSRNPLEAATLATTFAKEYYDLQVNRQIGQSQAASSRLDARVEQLRLQVANADSSIARFRLQNNLLNTAGSLSPEQEIATIQSDLAMAKAQAAEAAARRSASQYAIPGGGVNGPVNTNTISQLQQQKAEVERRVASLSARYGSKYPQLIDATKELAAINGQVGDEMRRIRDTTASEANVAASRASSLSASLASAQSRAAQNVAASVKLAELQREADNLRTLYQNLLASSSEENARRALVQPSVTITSPASVPLKASSPSLMLNLLGGMLAGLALGLGIAYLRERWMQGLVTVDDVTIKLGKKFLNNIPSLTSAIDNPRTTDPVEAISQHPMSAYTESFRNLATSLTYAAGTGKGRVIGITSALPKEGKTTTAIGIAQVLAQAGQKVLLVDADLRRRSVTEILYPSADKGLTEVISGQNQLTEVVLTNKDGLDVLPLAPKAHLGPMPFNNETFLDLLTHLRSVYDIIIFDTAPILAVSDTRVLLHQFDALALLSRWKTTPIRAVRAALHQIESVGGNVVGVALTMVNLKRQAESNYGDASYYYGYMKDYYTAS